MTAGEYRKALSKLGLSQEGAARYLGIGKRTSQAYALEELPVPDGVAVILRLLVSGKVTLEDVEAAHG